MTILSKPGDPVLVICAWHADFDKNDPINATASHGCCPVCMARMFGEEPKQAEAR